MGKLVADEIEGKKQTSILTQPTCFGQLTHNFPSAFYGVVP